MVKKILLYCIGFLQRMCYEKITLDKINSKLIRPVPQLIIDGRQYYEFVNAADMPQARLVHYTYLREEMSMGIDRTTLNEYFDRLLEANKTSDTNRIGSLLFMAKDTVNNLTTVESLFNMATLWYFDKDEDISTFDYDYNQVKLKSFKAFHDKGFFFGRLLEVSLKHTGLSLPADTQQFLNVNEAVLTAYSRIRGAQTASTG